MNALKAFIFLIFGFIIFPASCFGGDKPCTKLTMITQESLGFKEAELNIKEIKHFKTDPDLNMRSIRGRSISNPKACFMTFWRPTDQLARTRGYMFAIEKWISLYPLSHRFDWWPDWINIQVRLSQLTGKMFQSKKELRKWWNENKDYLTAQKSFGQLIVDNKAKTSKKVISKVFKMDISAENYWSVVSQDSFFDQWEDEQYIYGQAWEYSSEFIYYAKVLKSEVTKRNPKEKAFLDLLRFMATQENKNYESRTTFSNSRYHQIKRITGKPFKSSKELAEWWKANKDNLTLSDDGKRLVVR